ncbi:MAG: PilZ domain-containing protein [Oryzomonas sp.]
MKDARVDERIEAPLDIKVTWPAMQQVKRATTKDFSDGGAFVNVDFDPRPSVDTEMLLQLNGSVLGKEPPVLKARVVRVTDEGVAFRFVQDEAA